MSKSMQKKTSKEQGMKLKSGQQTQHNNLITFPLLWTAKSAKIRAELGSSRVDQWRDEHERLLVEEAASIGQSMDEHKEKGT